MISPTNIEPANRRTAFGTVPNGISAPRMERTVESPKIGKRWLVVVSSEDAESRALGFVREFAKGDAEIHLVKPSGSDSASEVRRLAIALEVDWLCMVAHRGSGLMSLFLRSDIERILRASPCPVFCIPESSPPAIDRPSVKRKAKSIRRALAPLKFPSPGRWQVEIAVAMAERFGAKLDLLGVDELLRNSDGARVTNQGAAKRRHLHVIKEELTKLSNEAAPKRMRGRTLASLGFPLFYATTRCARELNSNLIVLPAPTRLWTHHGRIDVGTERILHRAECPVICIPEPGELRRSLHADRHQVLRNRHRRTPPGLSSRLGPSPPRISLEARRHRFVSNTNPKRI